MSLHMVFSLAIAVAYCAALARISVFDPSSIMIVPRYLKWSTVSSSFPLTVILVVIGWALFVMSLVFWALVSMQFCEDDSSSCLPVLASSSFFPARPSISLSNLRLVIVRPPMLTVHEWSFKVSVMIRSRKMLKNVGDSRHPCQTPTERLPYLALYKYCIGSLCLKLLDGVDQLLAHVEFFHGGPKSIMPYSI